MQERNDVREVLLQALQALNSEKDKTLYFENVSLGFGNRQTVLFWLFVWS